MLARLRGEADAANDDRVGSADLQPLDEISAGVARHTRRGHACGAVDDLDLGGLDAAAAVVGDGPAHRRRRGTLRGEDARPEADRKSTRLNSSHLVISYA